MEELLNKVQEEQGRLQALRDLPPYEQNLVQERLWHLQDYIDKIRKALVPAPVVVIPASITLDSL